MLGTRCVVRRDLVRRSIWDHGSSAMQIARIKKPECHRALDLEFEIYRRLKCFDKIIFVNYVESLCIDVLCKFKNIEKHIFHCASLIAHNVKFCVRSACAFVAEGNLNI